MEVRKFRTKPEYVEVAQVPTFEGNEDEYRKAFVEVATWCGGTENWSRVRPVSLTVAHPKKGQMRVAEGELIMKDEHGAWKVSPTTLKRQYEEYEEFPSVEIEGYDYEQEGLGGT